MPASKLTRSFYGLAAGEAVARVLSFIASLVIARRLGPAMYGVIGVASGILLYLNQLADAGIELSGVPAVARTREGLSELVSSTLTVRVSIALALTVIVVLVGSSAFAQPDGSILALYALGLVFIAAGTRWVFVGMQRTTWVGGARIGGELVALAIVLVAVRGVGDVAAVPIAAVVGAALSAFAMLIGLRSFGVRVVPRFAWTTSRPLFERGPHLVGFTLLGLVLFNADLIYLRFISGQASAGYYSAAYTFIAFAANLSVAWAHSVMPSLASIDKTDSQRNAVFETALLLAYVVALPVAVGGMLTARPLMGLVFGPAFLPAVAALVWLLPAVPIAAVREIAVVGLIGSPGGERKLIRINASCAIFNIAILLPVVPRYGMVGAAAVTVLTEILRLFLAYRFASQEGFSTPALSRFMKPTLAAAAMVPALAFAADLPFMLLLVTGAAVYAVILFATGVLRFQRPFQVRLVV
jgi:O-antigen/teichoic acid export membrane protein